MAYPCPCRPESRCLACRVIAQTGVPNRMTVIWTWALVFEKSTQKGFKWKYHTPSVEKVYETEKDASADMDAKETDGLSYPGTWSVCQMRVLIAGNEVIPLEGNCVYRTGLEMVLSREAQK